MKTVAVGPAALTGARTGARSSRERALFACTERLVETVLDSLRPYITEGEWDDVMSTLPKDLVEILPGATRAARATPWT